MKPTKEVIVFDEYQYKIQLDAYQKKLELEKIGITLGLPIKKFGLTKQVNQLERDILLYKQKAIQLISKILNC